MNAYYDISLLVTATVESIYKSFLLFISTNYN